MKWLFEKEKRENEDWSGIYVAHVFFTLIGIEIIQICLELLLPSINRYIDLVIAIILSAYLSKKLLLYMIKLSRERYGK